MTRKPLDLTSLLGSLDAALVRCESDGADRVRFGLVSDGVSHLLGISADAAMADADSLLGLFIEADRKHLRSSLDGAIRGIPQPGREVETDSGLRLSVTIAPLDDGAVMLFVASPVHHKTCACQAERQRQIIELLHDVAATANEAPDAHTAMRRCLDRLCLHGGWPIGHVWSASEDEPRRLIPTDLWHIDDPARFAEWGDRTQRMVLSMGEGLPGRAFAAGQPEWVTDVRTDDLFLRAAMARRLGVRTGFAIPVRIGLEVVAVMEFFSTEALEPDALLFQALNHIGIQIGRVVERDRATRNLRVVGEMAQAASRAKTNFLANMSHELRTPLNAIIGFSETMATEVFGPMANERYRDYAASIHVAGNHLLDLVNDILDLSSIEARRMVLKEAPVDLGIQIALAVQLMRAKADHCHVAITTEVAPDLPVVMGDPLRLRQVLLNLLSNAIRATLPGGSVHVWAFLDLQNGLVLSVADTGCGMSHDEINHAFRAFESPATAFTTRAEAGMGLGLPLSKALIELHGGVIELKSELGNGTIATLRLPPDRLRQAPLQQVKQRGH